MNLRVKSVDQKFCGRGPRKACHVCHRECCLRPLTEDGSALPKQWSSSAACGAWVLRSDIRLVVLDAIPQLAFADGGTFTTWHGLFLAPHLGTSGGGHCFPWLELSGYHPRECGAIGCSSTRTGVDQTWDAADPHTHAQMVGPTELCGGRRDGAPDSSDDLQFGHFAWDHRRHRGSDLWRASGMLCRDPSEDGCQPYQEHLRSDTSGRSVGVSFYAWIWGIYTIVLLFLGTFCSPRLSWQSWGRDRRMTMAIQEAMDH